VRYVEVLFSDAGRAARARDALAATAVGAAAWQVIAIRDVFTYDHLASLRHSLAYSGAVLGAIGAGLRVAVGLMLVSLALELGLELGIIYLWTVVAFAYGALVGLLVGSQLPAPGPRAMRQGLARGKAVVRVMTGDLASAMLAHDLLVRQPAAERSLDI
jgi:hypothetical protein